MHLAIQTVVKYGASVYREQQQWEPCWVGAPEGLALTAANALAGPTACRPQTTRPPSTWPCSSPSPDRSVPPAPRPVPGPAQRGLGRDLCVRRPRLPGSLSPGVESSAKARGLVRWSADRSRPSPAFGGHTRNPEGPRLGWGPGSAWWPQGSPGSPRRSLPEPGAELRGGDSVTEGPGRHTRSLGHRPEDAGGARGGDPSLADTEGGAQRRTAAPRPPSPRGARLAVSAFLAAASCRCLCRAPPLRPRARRPPVRDAGGDPSTFPERWPEGDSRVSSPDTPFPRQDGPRPRS